MTRTFAKTASAALLAIGLGLGAMTGPALAGGQISFGVTAADPEQAQAMRLGMLFYGIAGNLSRNGGIVQHGNGNAAGVVQGGNGNFGVVHQVGNGHNGTIEQAGSNNTCGLFQFGENTDGRCVQNGGETGTTFQFGW
jgi:hypothetical protein